MDCGGPFEKESAAAERARKLREAEGSKYSSNLLSMLQGGAAGDGSSTEPAEGSALSMLRGNAAQSGNNKMRDDIDDDDD